MRLVTWNVNSVRLRLEQLARIDMALRPDVVCLQETKVADPQFPREALEALGYHDIAIFGQKSYNGVAIASRLPLEDVRSQNWCGRDDCRHLIARVGEVEVHCLYIPAGGDIPDPEVNGKFAHKLEFLDSLTAWFAAQDASDRPRVLVGDLNIAPLPTDVWSHRQMLKIVTHTPIEIEKMTALQESLGWVDAVRHFIPPAQRLSTWWSYRAADWAASDRGRRLDHIWVTPQLTPRLTGAAVFAESRGWQQPSDHAPVMIDLA
ncbi:exodeoxyribonuclease III [Telmatospirillum siberiense]|uniref:Exodeoxyribonuclease III n=1 Tax=Telmatospirillum siberiense TaxID=382514 RepID=A0A2N3PN11_9PROT|nr:exodeoxyribonuclease III [Telmatospirillum siberiense]PKU21791.1 exodeoxyribonuclease III [Telmatospirillum siberiense]